VTQDFSNSERLSGEAADSALSLSARRNAGDVNISSDLLDNLVDKTPIYLRNSRLGSASEVLPHLGISRADLDAAARRLRRWAPSLAILFPELRDSHGMIESRLIPLPAMAAGRVTGAEILGTAFIKADHDLPVAGSIKARGGLYEILVYAEKMGVAAGLMQPDGDPYALLTGEARQVFSNLRVGVGSTGNLGLSVGIMASALGFRTMVHMSSDAKEWKKSRLRRRGVEVVEHTGDYATAVAAGREAMADSPSSHFVDDENSMDLLLGYSVAALRLQKQLHDANTPVNEKSPLFVYLPCGVGGAPGGIAWGLKLIFGDAVHCFFAEPVASPAFLVRMLSDHPCSVYDYGLDNKTEADGLAVARASELVFSLVNRLVSGFYTVADDEFFRTLVKLEQTTGERIEPSAAAGFLGPARLAGRYFAVNGQEFDPASVTHLFWTTGGAFVPNEEYQRFYQHGIALLQGEPRVSL
jgi:D-serine dehydratase